MKPLFVILIVFLLPLACFAQPTYIAGYVLKSNGDTVKGYIKYPNYAAWAACPKYIEFKLDRHDREALRFDPHTIREFHIDGHETYITYAGWVSADGNVFPMTGFKLDTSKKLDTIFLKQVTTGKFLTLYYHNDKFKTRFFISENNGPKELEYHLYFKTPNTMVSRPVYSAYIVSLVNKYAPGNKRLMSEISEMSFSQASLQDFVEDINNLGHQP